jgi:hypothetical protein
MLGFRSGCCLRLISVVFRMFLHQGIAAMREVPTDGAFEGVSQKIVHKTSHRLAP